VYICAISLNLSYDVNPVLHRKEGIEVNIWHYDAYIPQVSQGFLVVFLSFVMF
jgi:hypothetical protein